MILRHARVKAGLTQEELGEKLGKYKTYVTKYERGERQITVLDLIDIAEMLDVDPLSIMKAVMAE
jgi:transcriptional regulator with XRE-family HTH domain